MNVLGIFKLFGKVGKWTAQGLALVPMIGQVIALVEALKTLKGSQKQDAAVDLMRAILQAGEEATGRDLLNNEEVEKAVRAAIDAIVALQNVLAKTQRG